MVPQILKFYIITKFIGGSAPAAVRKYCIILNDSHVTLSQIQNGGSAPMAARYWN